MNGSDSNRRPARPPRKPFLLRLPPEVLEELRGWANQDLRSLNAHVEFLLREALRKRRGAGSGPASDAGPEGRAEPGPGGAPGA